MAEYVNVDGLRTLTKVLKHAEGELGKQLRVGLRNAGKIVQVAAQVRAAEFSREIPATITVSVTQKNVAVVAHGGQAVSWETHGKHPVFDSSRKRWNKVPNRHPYMRPALQEKKTEVTQAVGKAIADIFKE